MLLRFHEGADVMMISWMVGTSLGELAAPFIAEEYGAIETAETQTAATITNIETQGDVYIGGSVIGGDYAVSKVGNRVNVEVMQWTSGDEAIGDLNISANNVYVGGDVIAGLYGDVNISANKVFIGGRIIEAGGYVNICATCYRKRSPLTSVAMMILF
jgi:hypothetical protein